MRKCFGNLYLGNHLDYFGDKISLNGRKSPISLISRQNNPKHHRNYFDCFCVWQCFLSLRKFAKHSGANSWQSSLSSLRDSTQTRGIVAIHKICFVALRASRNDK